MIITVTLNAAVDNTLAVPHFRIGGRHRAVEQSAAAGGKGINVARALKCLGQPVIATGFAGGSTGTRIIEQLTAESVLADFVRITGESRTSTAVIDPTSNIQTEINEHGPVVSEAEQELFREKLLYLANGADICVIAGSIPRGIDSSFYADLIVELRKAGVKTFLDADGDVMRRGIRAEPDFVSPNAREAEELVGHEFNDDEDIPAGLAELRQIGARNAIVTTQQGCWAALSGDESQVLKVTLDPLEVVSPVGAGDAFLAGFVSASYIGLSDEPALRYAVACGADSTQHFGAGIVDRQAVDHLVDKVKVETVSLPVVG